jgi:hypothetical protein
MKDACDEADDSELVLVDPTSAADAQDVEGIVGEFLIDDAVCAYAEPLCWRMGVRHIYNITQAEAKAVDSF